MSLDDGHVTGYQLALSGRGPHMSDVVDIIDREASPAELARVATIIASDPQFAVFRDRSVCREAAAARPEAH